MSGQQGPVRVALIGFGGSARTIHLPLIRAVPELQLAAVVPTSDGARVRTLAAGLPVVSAIDELPEHGVDLAVVATPDVAHLADAEQALAAGLDVVVEKPVAATLADAETLQRSAQRAGRRIVPFQNRRWDSDFLTVRRLLAEGALGRPVRFDSRLTRWSPTIGPNWRDQRREGTLDGRLADIGAHLVDQAIVLFGPVASVYAEIETVRPGAVANDDCFIALRHESGVLSHLHMSSLSAPRLPRLRLQGLTGAYVKYGADPQQDALGAGGDPAAGDWGLEDPADAGVVTTDHDAVATSERGDWTAFYRGVAAMQLDGAAPPVALDDAIDTLRVLDAAARSGRERGVVTVPPDASYASARDEAAAR
jgi:scyllo-inositol 2-dehydrogenase (NADP+)